MKKRTFPMIALAAALSLPTAMPAVAAPPTPVGTDAVANVRVCTIRAINNTGQTATGAFWAGSGTSGVPPTPANLKPTVFFGSSTNSGWGKALPTASAKWMYLTWQNSAGPGFNVLPGQNRDFTVAFAIPGTALPYSSQFFMAWTNPNLLIPRLAPGPGWSISSPPVLTNFSELDGAPNTQNLVVRNIQFAISSTRIKDDDFRVDSPAVTAAFAASADVARAGPFSVVPGGSQSFTVHPSITDPVVKGQTMLVRGTFADANGNQYQFVDQFINQSTVPAGGPVALAVLAFGLMVLGGFTFWRSGARRLA